MTGYTPLFSGVFQGSLCGKYPDLPVWLVLLALCDRHGVIDAHPAYIATVSGLPQADIEAAIQTFCEPDTASRTPDEEGRRLEPLPDRGFGWRILNHSKYREKARLQSQNAAQVADGRNAEKVRRYKERKKREAEHADTRGHPPTPSPNIDININKEEEKAPTDVAPGLDEDAWNRWTDYRKKIRKPIKPASKEAAMRKMAKLGKAQADAVEHSIANGYQGLIEPPRKAADSNRQIMEEWTNGCG